METSTSDVTNQITNESTTSSKTTSTFPTTLADLSFHLPDINTPSSTQSIYKTLHTLKKATLNIPNRLTSVLQDAKFISALSLHLNSHSTLLTPCPVPPSNKNANELDPQAVALWPLIPNERSGSWPLNPSLKHISQQPHLSPSTLSPTHLTDSKDTVSAYFKSTDGHVSNWSFSARRLNLPVLSLLGSASGCVLIDTTRRGKSFPDALRRTVPIWTCVWNRVLFPELVESGENGRICDFQDFGLGKGEARQIEQRMAGFVEALRALDLDLDGLRKRVTRPVRCVWVVQPMETSEWDGTFNDLVEQIEAERCRWEDNRGVNGINILICCSASKQVTGAEMSENGYIQGAGDDSEGWSLGLNASLFWEHLEELMSVVKNGGDIDEIVTKLVVANKLRSHSINNEVLIQPTNNLYLGTSSASHAGESVRKIDLLVDCNAPQPELEHDVRVLGLGCKDGKLGSKMLRDKLPALKTRIGALLTKTPRANLHIICSTGKDLSVGVALAILCCFYDEHGAVITVQNRCIDKQFVKQRLAWITSSKPDANPSRATLQAVNAFLMERPD